MDAVLITGPRRVETIDVPEPEATPGRAALDVGLCGICGTDVHAWESGTAYAPFLCGHEWFGTVTAVGPGVSGLSVGQRAVMGTPPACGQCGPCRAGHWHRCQAMFGLFVGALHGGYAPRIAVPAAALVPVPEPLSDVEAAQVEPATVALHAVRRRPPRLGDVVVVLGAGPIGLAAAQWAKRAGAWRVVVAEPRPARRALAAELGADAAVPPGELSELVASLTGRNGADVVYDCAGSESSMAAAGDAARAGGAIMLVGVPMAPMSVHPGLWLGKELSVETSLAHHRHEFEITMRAVADGHIRLEPMHARTVGLASVGDAIAALAGGSDDVKILVDPRV